MITFLTSDPLWEDGDTSTLNEANGFVSLLRDYWKKPMKCLFIASDPIDFKSNDENRARYGGAIEASGLPVESFDLLDFRTLHMSDEQIWSYDMIMLCGGHIPTEWAWFEEIELTKQLKHFDGLLIGISAGSMNCAKEVFALPEGEGELDDPDYEWYFEGLGCVKTNIIPHFQAVYDIVLDGRKLIEEVACSCSYGHNFLGLTDGSFVLVDQGVELVFGEAYLISEGKITQFCIANECRELYNYGSVERWGAAEGVTSLREPIRRMKKKWHRGMQRR